MKIVQQNTGMCTNCCEESFYPVIYKPLYINIRSKTLEANISSFLGDILSQTSEVPVSSAQGTVE